MPAYNAAKYIKEAIDSILAQTYCDFEFIIVNDGSTDNTKEIILSYSDPRIVYIENEQNSGICVTLNKGLDAAKGRYIVRMDSDDIALPQRLEVQVRYMDANPGIGASGSDIEIFGEGISPHIFEQLHTPDECKAGLLFNSCFAHPSVIIRKDILDQYNLQYNDDFRGLEDYELWWQIGKYADLNNIAVPLLRYRHHKNQETQNVSKQVAEAFFGFISVRFQDLGIDLSLAEAEIIKDYSTGRSDLFNHKRMMRFIDLCAKIANNFPNRGPSVINAIKLTLSKGITFTINQNKELRPHAQKYSNRAFIKGIFPIIWFAKTSYYNLLKR